MKRQVGNTGLHVEPIMLGGNVFGWTIDEKQSFEILDGFVAAGMNFIDTADSYSRWAPGNKGGESETIIGNWMKQRKNHDKVIVATKVGSDIGQGKKDISKEHILKAVEGSLKRLQVDRIDLYQTHWDDNTTPVDETLEAHTQLIKQGKVRYIGASNLSAKRLLDSLNASEERGFARYESFQPHYNLYERATYETELEQICIDNKLGVVCYYSLASGFLTGKYRTEDDLNKSPRGAAAKAYMNERGFRILKALDEVAEKHNSTPASVALAWLIARPSVTAPIASATSTKQLKSLIEATRLQLSKEDIEVLDVASKY